MICIFLLFISMFSSVMPHNIFIFQMLTFQVLLVLLSLIVIIIVMRLITMLFHISSHSGQSRVTFIYEVKFCLERQGDPWQMLIFEIFIVLNSIFISWIIFCLVYFKLKFYDILFIYFRILYPWFNFRSFYIFALKQI